MEWGGYPSRTIANLTTFHDGTGRSRSRIPGQNRYRLSGHARVSCGSDNGSGSGRLVGRKDSRVGDEVRQIGSIRRHSDRTSMSGRLLVDGYVGSFVWSCYEGFIARVMRSYPIYMYLLSPHHCG